MIDTFQHRLSVLKELRGLQARTGAVVHSHLFDALSTPDKPLALLWEMMDRLEGLEDENEKLRGMPDDDRKSCIALMELLAEARTERDAHRKALEALDFHDSDCATHNMPAELNGQCNCWIEKARNLLSSQWSDSEDHERFFSWYGANFLDAVDRVDRARALSQQPDQRGK